MLVRNPSTVASPAGTEAPRPWIASATSVAATLVAARSGGRSVTHITARRSPMISTLPTPSMVASCGTTRREA